MSIKVLVKRKNLNEADENNAQVVDSSANTSTGQQTDASTNQQADASTNQPAVDINKFVQEVQNLYTGLVTDLKKFFIPDELKKNYLTSYVELTQTDLYKGKEKAFADAVNNFQKIDPKNTKEGLNAFSTLISAMQTYVDDVVKTTQANTKQN